MTLLFLILLLLLALAAQMRVFQCSLKMLRSDYWPERKIVDPEDPFDVVVSVRNMSNHYVPFVKVEEFFRLPFYVQQQDEHISGDAVRGGALFTGTADLRAYQEVQFRIPVAVRERGRYVLGHPELAGGDFLGLREKTKTMEQYREKLGCSIPWAIFDGSHQRPQSPLFMAYHDHQPFNSNHLQPCPMLENPEMLKVMVARSGARSTDLESPESADHLCGKCEAYAARWAPEADRLWRERGNR